MNHKILLGATVAVALGAWIVRPIFSEDKPGGILDKPGEILDDTKKAGEMPTELMGKGPEHDKMAARVGNYEVTGKMWEKSDAPAKEIRGTAEIRTILDGLFLEESFKGTCGDKEFKGLEICGYDRIAGKYTSYWCDSMWSSSMFLTGDLKEDGKTVELRGQGLNPMNKQPLHVRMVFIEKSPSEFVVEGYCDAEGTEKKSMELTYKKKS